MDNEPRRMIVVGTGGVGNWLSRGLAMLLAHKYPGSILLLVDGDTFEPKNAERQFFKDVGKKAVVLASELQAMYPNTFIVPDDRWVISEDSTDESGVKPSDLIEENDVVFATVDNFAARKLLFDAGREFDNIDIFTGGNDHELFGSVYHYQRRNGKDITDHPADYHAELENPPDRNPGELSCQERAQLEGGTQLTAVNMAVSSMLLARTHVTIVKGEEDEAAEIMFDLATGESSPYDRRVIEETVDLTENSQPLAELSK